MTTPETFPAPDRNRAGKEPCGECSIQPGETCDICGASTLPDTKGVTEALRMALAYLEGSGPLITSGGVKNENARSSVRAALSGCKDQPAEVAWRWRDGDNRWQCTADEDRASYAFRVDGYKVIPLYDAPTEAIPAELWALCYLHDWDPPKEGQEHRWEPGKNVFPEVHAFYRTWQEAEAVRRDMGCVSKYWVVRARPETEARLAALSPPEPTETRNEEFGFVEFINADVPFIVREIDGHVAILLDIETRAVIGYRVYDPAKATEGIAELVGRLNAKDALWQEQCDVWIKGARANGLDVLTLNTFESLRQTVYAEAAALLTAIQAERDEARADITRGIEEEQRLQSRILRETEARERAEAELAAMKEGAAVAWLIKDSDGVLTPQATTRPQEPDETGGLIISPLYLHPAPADKGVVEAAREMLKVFAIYTVEDDDGIRLSTGGHVVAHYGEHSPEGIALLKLDAHYRAIAEALAASPPAEGDGR